MKDLEYLNQAHPVRRSEAQKEAFRQDVIKDLSAHGVSARVELTSDGKNKNVIVGDPLTAKTVLSAHYDTPARSVFPNLMIPRCLPLFWAYQFLPVVLLLAVSLGGGFLFSILTNTGERGYMAGFLVLYYALFFLLFRGFSNPHNQNDNTSGVATVLSAVKAMDPALRDDLAVILFDNEEKGKKGSKAYYKDHKDALQNRTLINFDCVGVGEDVVFIAMKEAEKSPAWGDLQKAFCAKDAYRVSFYPIKGSESNSDYKNFPCGIGCMTCKRTHRGLLYTPWIHTSRDTVARQENIDFIVGGLQRFLAPNRKDA